MPQINFEQPEFAVELPDLVKGQTINKRKAEQMKLLYAPSGKIVSITFQVRQYAKNEDGSFGEALGISEEVMVNALVDSFLQIETLAPLCPGNEEYVQVQEEQQQDTGEVDEEGNPITTTITVTSTILNPILEGKNYCKQFDYYNYIANHQPVIINQVITQIILSRFPANP